MDDGRAQPYRYLGSEARCPARNSRAVRDDPHGAARRAIVRASAEAGGDARSHDDHPLGRCAVFESRTEHGHADGQLGGRAATEPRRGQVSGHRLAGGAISRAERSGPAAVCVAELERSQPSGLGRISRQAIRSVRRHERRRSVQAAGRARPAAARLAAGVARAARSAAQEPRPVGLDGGARSIFAAGRRYRGRRTSPGGVRSVARAASRCAIATANIPGASRRCWPGGWSRRA